MKYKKLLCSAVSAAMLMCMLPAGVWAQAANAAPPGQTEGYSQAADGSTELPEDSDKTTQDNTAAVIPKDAIFVDSAEVLTAIAEAVENGVDLSDRYYLQTEDIDLGDVPWKPIGNSYEMAFSGHYNGGGHTISSLNIQGESDSAGLFGYLLGATVENVTIESGRVGDAAAYMGALAGVANRSLIMNCRNRAEVVNGRESGIARTGGLAGVAYASKIYNCANEGLVTAGNIEGDNFFQGVGGLIGLTGKGAEIAGCYNLGGVEAPVEANTGALAACIASAEDNFKNCYWSEEEGLSAAAQKNPEAAIVGEAKAAAEMASPEFSKEIAVDCTGLTVTPPTAEDEDIEEDLSGDIGSAGGSTETERWVTIGAVDVVLDFNLESYDLLTGVEATDESGAKAAVTVADDGGFDPGAAGTYTVVYRAQHPEAAGVEAVRSVTVTVKNTRTIDSSSLTAENFSRPKLKDVRKAFDAISTEGTAYSKPNNKGIDSNLFHVDDNHMQGVAVYGDYVLIATSMNDTEDNYIMIYDQNTCRFVYQEKMPYGHGFVHSGGIQVLGDFLYAPVYGSTGAHNEENSMLTVYDLRPLNEGKAPVWVDSIWNADLPMDNAAVGITNYTNKDGVEKLIMVDADFSVFESDIPINGKTFNWVKKTAQAGTYRPSNWSDSNVALLTDQNNDVYIIRLAYTNGPSTNKIIQAVADKLGFDSPAYFDSIALHKITFSDSTYYVGPTIAEKDVNPYDSETALGSHFRYTGSIDVKNEDYFSVISTSSLPLAFHLNFLQPELSDAVTALLPFTDIMCINEYKPETDVVMQNNAAVVAKADVSYTADGVRHSASTGSVTLGLEGRVAVPPGAANIEIKTSMYTGTSWKLISTKNYASRDGKAIGFTVKGTLFDYAVVDGLEESGPQYKVTIKTADVDLAGTDANIYMKLIGTEGTTDEQLLSYGMYGGDLTGNAFEQGQTDSAVFNFSKDIGEITGVVLRSDMKWAAASWLPESITIEPTANVSAAKPVTINVHQWIGDTREHAFYTGDSQVYAPFTVDDVKKDRVNDVEASFNGLSISGKQAMALPSDDFPAEIIDTSNNHIQGMALYEDMVILTVNAQSSSEAGYYFVYNKDGMVLSMKAGSIGHTGGMDVSGDLMVCADYGTTLYDLRPLKEGKPMIKLWSAPDIGGCASAITTYTDAGGAERIVILDANFRGYESVMPADGKSFHFQKLRTGSVSTVKANNFTLLTDAQNNIWAVEMDSAKTGQGDIADITGLGNLNYQDQACLSKVTIQNGIVSSERVASKEFKPFDSSRLALACFMRFAATAVPTEDGGLSIYSSRSLPGNVFAKAVGSWANELLNIFGENKLYLNVYEEESILSFKNLSGTVAKADVTYTVNGEAKSQSTGSFTLGFTENLTIPKNAGNITIKFYVNTLTSWKLVDTRQYSGLSGSSRSYTFENTVFNPKVTEGIVAGEGVQYKVTVKTANKTNAGTDSDIYLRIMGTKGTTDEAVLNYSMLGQLGVYINAFEKNATDTGNVLVSQDIGEITGISLRSDMSLLAADWYPEYVEIAPLYNTTATKPVRFTIDEWIADKETHVYSNDASKSTQYDLTIKTGDKFGAGTDSNIYVSLIGSTGQTAEREISEIVNGNAFERNSTDSARVNFDKNIGEIKGVVVRSDMKLAAAEWFVDWIKVEPVAGGAAQTAQGKTFVANAWITDKTPRTYSMDPNSIVQYRMSFKTGDKFQAGTDSNIYVVLAGSDGKTTNEMEVSEIVSGNAFERGNTDTITVNFSSGIGDLSKLRIRSDMKWAGAGWYLDWVKVQPMVNGEDYGPEKTFSLYEWIEDKNTRELNAQ